jgi:hypothetical protein
MCIPLSSNVIELLAVCGNSPCVKVVGVNTAWNTLPVPE